VAATEVPPQLRAIRGIVSAFSVSAVRCARSRSPIPSMSSSDYMRLVGLRLMARGDTAVG
jgi:hypothetical protein